MIKLMLALFGLAMQRSLTYRTNMMVELCMTLLGSVASIMALSAIYANVSELAGWTFGETLILLGTYQLISGLFNALVTPNLSFFREKVIGGSLDDYLLRPVPSLYSASFNHCHPLALMNAGVGIVILTTGLVHLEEVPSVPDSVAYLFVLAIGFVIAWAYRVVLASLAFWMPGSEPSVIYDALWELGRYPLSVYKAPLRKLLTFVVPVALVGTMPASILTEGAQAKTLLAAVGIGAGAFTAALLCWSAGLRRYTSAGG
ncbi:ABC-2 type transport system permease protein [Paenibacillus sp. UNCCL117]|uniref:ABC transporter permease n=1 Tax=unclassified Paenibacillus TaxID=185978 RepID=UPI00088F1FCC|nr:MULTISPECIES: ABC-2 family transporter protein [unclassified Paenibacillus]SDD77014.1 ABC-2 type transport system permease protein [Paenibacillus sp. cl123]SFW52604.1 ABC-2 type transport system permease protein [Paenibacillus sp. UNCCL117]